MNAEEKLSDLIASIYDAVGNSSLWDPFLHKVADAVEGTATVILFFNADERVGSTSSAVRVDPHHLRLFNEHYINIDQWAVHGRRHYQTGRVDRGDVLCPNDVLKHSEYYADFLRRVDIFHHVHAIIDTQGPHMSVFSSSKPERAGRFSDQSLRLLRLLLPHMQRAFSLHSRLSALEDERGLHLDVLDCMPVGVAVISAQGHVVMLNALAQKMFVDDDGLKYSPAGLRAARPQESRQLQSLIARAIETSAGRGTHAGGVMVIARPSGRRPYQVLVSPYRSCRNWPGPNQPAVTVFISDPERRTQSAGDLLMQLYGLTSAEAKLASMLLTGTELAAAATELEITANTARTHLKRIFSKTGTRRQAGLVHQLLTGLTSLALDRHDP